MEIPEMYTKHRIESELLEWESILEKKNLFENFEKLKLIDSLELSLLTSFLRDEINNIIERKNRK